MMLPWPLLGFQLAQSIIHHSLSSSAIKHSPLPLSAGICCNPPAIVVLTERSHLRSGQPDSLYGSRHLAERMAHTPHPLGSTHTNLLQAVVTINYVPFLHKGQRVCSYTDTHYHNTTSPWLMEFCLMKYFQSCISFFLSRQLRCSCASCHCHSLPPVLVHTG